MRVGGGEERGEMEKWRERWYMGESKRRGERGVRWRRGKNERRRIIGEKGEMEMRWWRSGEIVCG